MSKFNNMTISDVDDVSDETNVADLPLWADADAHERLSGVCDKYRVPIDVLTDLVSLQRERQHQERAHGIFKTFEEILGRMDD
ncbi:DNA modification system-associated small protein [Burkholderia ubonensis]|uniref:DNA modification system-associated small protein n=1 Tax=Burkholderia ubonensis TaxID=101571 RepID=UPI00116109D5|nr:DNA modification system-associated small protein [Burkholderia ubonensis]